MSWSTPKPVNDRPRFLIIDLDTQIDGRVRFAVWDQTVDRFWKINGHQTWTSAVELAADFEAIVPAPQFQPSFFAQRDSLVAQVVECGFDREHV